MDGWWFGWFGILQTTNPNHSVISAWEAQQHQNLDMFMLCGFKITSQHLFSSSLKGHRSAFNMSTNCPNVANLILPTIPNFTIHGFVAITWLQDTLGIFISKLPPHLTRHFFIIPVIPVNWKFQLTSSPIVFCHILLVGGFNPSWNILVNGNDYSQLDSQHVEKLPSRFGEPSHIRLLLGSANRCYRSAGRSAFGSALGPGQRDRRRHGYNAICMLYIYILCVCVCVCVRVHVCIHIYTLHYITLHYITLHYITLHYITLHYITLHYITLHYITLHYITLHYIHTYIYIYICVWLCVYINIYHV